MVVSIGHTESLCKDIKVAEALLELLPASLRKKYDRAGISKDTLAEIVIAYAKGTMCLGDRAHGMDNEDGSESKFATIAERPRNNGYTYINADIANLKNKTGDLHVILADPDNLTGKSMFRFFTFPYKVWKSRIPGDKLTFSFKRRSWYSFYEQSQKEFFSSCSL